jgi:hypothetical protein
MTVEEVARDALAAVTSEAGVLLASRWVANRYVELCALGKPRHLRRSISITIPGLISAGTAAVDRGSRKVYGDATALAAWSPVVGRYIRLRTSWYEISAVGAEYLTLSEPFAENDVGTTPVGPGGVFSGASYLIAARHVEIPLRYVISAAHPRRHLDLELIGHVEMEVRAPARIPVRSGPLWLAEVGAYEGHKIFETYPYSDEDEHVEVAGYVAPPQLALRELIPESIDPYVLREGAIIDVMRWEAGRAARAGQVDAAAYWRNEYRAQETRWMEFKRHAYKTDTAIDDVAFVVPMRGRTGSREIATARDEIWTRGNRP